MANDWDVKQGMMCLLEILERPEWDADLERDLIEELVLGGSRNAAPGR